MASQLIWEFRETRVYCTLNDTQKKAIEHFLNNIKGEQKNEGSKR